LGAGRICHGLGWGFHDFVADGVPQSPCGFPAGHFRNDLTDGHTVGLSGLQERSKDAFGAILLRLACAFDLGFGQPPGNIGDSDRA
jgi:hypothetical protein